MTHWKKIVSDPDYLGEADFEEGEEKIGTIARVESKVKVKSSEGTQEKAVVYFAEPMKPMILNVARSKAITKVTGSPYTENWPGHSIQLYIDHNVKAFGDVVSAVRVRPRKPAPKQACLCSRCGKPITGAMGRSADYIAQYTAKKFGMALCFDCASPAKAEPEKAAEGGTENAQTETVE